MPNGLTGRVYKQWRGASQRLSGRLLKVNAAEFSQFSAQIPEETGKVAESGALVPITWGSPALTLSHKQVTFAGFFAWASYLQLHTKHCAQKAKQESIAAWRRKEATWS